MESTKKIKNFRENVKEIDQLSKKKIQTRIFQPFRAIGYVTNEIPFDIQARGQVFFITTCVGNSFHVYDCAKLGLKCVGTKTDKPITALASFGDFTYVACSQDLIVYEKNRENSRYFAGSRGSIFSIVIFGNWLIALCENDNKFIVWDHITRELEAEISFDNDFTVTTMIHPSTYLNKILVGSREGTMQIWNVVSKKLKYSFSSFGSPITFLTQSPVVDVVAIGLLDGRIILHNIKLDELLISYKQEGRVTSISFRTDEHHIMASSNMYGDIALWDLDKQRLSHIMKGAHEGLIPSIKFLNGQPILVTSGADNSVKEWIFDSLDEAEPRLLKSRSGHHASPTQIQYYDSDGHFIISAARDRSLRAFSIVRDSQSVELSQGSLVKKNKKFTSARQSIDELKLPQIIQFSASETKQKEWDNIVTCHINDNGARTWSFQSKVIGKHIFRTNDESLVKTSNISACGNFGFIGTSSGTIEIFNMQSGIHRKTFAGDGKHVKAISGLAGDSLNRILISSSLDGTVKIWDFNSAKLLHTINVISPITILKFHTMNDLLAIATDDLGIRVIDVETRKIVREFWGHRNRITDMTFSPDGRWIISSSLDATIRTWDLPTGHLIDVFEVDHIVTSLAFSPKGDFLATTHVDLVGIYLWANRTQFTNVTLRKIIDDDEILSIGLPTTSGVDSDAEDFSVIDSEMTNKKSFETPEQLTEQMITLSSLPKSKWQNLLNLDTIKKRNKPKEPPKPLEKAPFFLPTLPGVDPKFIPVNNTHETDKKMQNDKFIKFGDIEMETKFIKILKNNHFKGEYTEFFNFAKTLNPSAIDFELRSFSLKNDFEDLKYFLDAIESRIKSKKDFELIQAYLNHFLKIYGDIIVNNPQNFKNYLESILNEHRKEWSRIEELIHYNDCRPVV
ncbi:6972_t:CDS:10 [Diversispora eburnea]|uniref:6972_t:CDS:1 n=1 Tax=Diversispora eburnea TaxID=1213867 RepID=A0A9N8V3B4_9GLOM|nr:6972_t:CDS:10 [Diversispora eburnea]